ncbi:MAG: hypothetical protein LBJ78_02160 [Puniceicoccales bacterium]|nr:hypothetical protein [Puniceicoccales bacterium]
MIEKACSTHKIKHVILQIDPDAYLYPAYATHPNRNFPYDLYKNKYRVFAMPHIWKTFKIAWLICCSHLFNKDSFKLGAPFPWHAYQDLNNLYTSWDWPEIQLRYKNFQKSVRVAAETYPCFLQYTYNKPINQDFSAIEQHLLSCFKKYFDVHFYLLICPFSLWRYKYDPNSFFQNMNKVINFIDTLCCQIEPCKNVNLYGFNNCQFPSNLKNYHDMWHYNPDINRFMLHCIVNKKHRLTTSNVQAYLNQFIQNVNRFTLKDNNGKIDSLEDLLHNE